MQSEKSPSVHNDRAGRPTGKGLCFKPTTNVVDTKGSAPTTSAMDRLNVENEGKAYPHNTQSPESIFTGNGDLQDASKDILCFGCKHNHTFHKGLKDKRFPNGCTWFYITTAGSNSCQCKDFILEDRKGCGKMKVKNNKTLQLHKCGSVWGICEDCKVKGASKRQ